MSERRTARRFDRRTIRFFAAFLLAAVVVAGFVSFYASSKPDGLTKVAEDKGFAAQEKDHKLKDSPVGDYGVKGVDNERLSGGLAGVIGVGGTLVVAGGLFWAVRRRADRTGPAGPAGPAGPGGSAEPAGHAEPAGSADDVERSRADG